MEQIYKQKPEPPKKLLFFEKINLLNFEQINERLF